MRKQLLIYFILFYLFIFSSNSYSDDPFYLDNQKKFLLSQPLKYADAKQLVAYLNQPSSHWHSPSGTVIADERTNTLVLDDDPSHLEKMQKLIQALDRPLPEVMIHAKMVLVDDYSERKLGSKLSSSLTINHQAPFIHVKDLAWFNWQLDLLEAKGHIRVVAAPELVTHSRQTASIESGEELPYQEKTGEGNTSISFKKAVLALKVTPIVLPGEQILLKLSVSQNKASGLMIQGSPAITTQELHTDVIIPNGSTYVLGGITQTATQTQRRGLPWLMFLPGAHQHEEHAQKLMIFITPELLLTPKNHATMDAHEH
jgi:type IV pilus assembly protein PilQ